MVDGRDFWHMPVLPGLVAGSGGMQVPGDRFSDGGTFPTGSGPEGSSGNGANPLHDYCFKQLFSKTGRFKGKLTGAFSGLPVAAFLGSCVWSIEGEIGRPVASVSVSQISDREIMSKRGCTVGDAHAEDAPGGCRPRRVGVPRLAIVLHYLYWETPENSGKLVIPTESFAPPPPWELGWREEGPEGFFNVAVRHPQKFPAFWIFVQENPGIRTFARKFFGFFKFRPENFWDFQISRQHFSGFLTFNRKFFWF